MGCGIAIVKYLVFIFNLVFGIIGVALLAVGIIYKLNLKILIDSVDDAVFIAPAALIAVGSLIFVISFFGCCGAIRESKCMLITYAIFLILIIVLQVAIGIFALIAVKEVPSIKDDCRKEIKEQFNKYNATVEDKMKFDDMQASLRCCGVDGPSDWHGAIPSSCCEGTPEKCTTSQSSLYKKGCAEKSYESLKVIVESIGYVAFGICVVEILGIVFAFCLTNSMRNQYRRGTYA